MTVNTSQYSVVQRAKAGELLARSATWAQGYRVRDQIRFYVFSSDSAPGVVYLTHLNGLGCTCPGAARSRRGRCFHMLAASLETDRAREEVGYPADDLVSDETLVSAF